MLSNHGTLVDIIAWRRNGKKVEQEMVQIMVKRAWLAKSLPRELHTTIFACVLITMNPQEKIFHVQVIRKRLTFIYPVVLYSGQPSI